jgi:hypothetical protein
MSTPVEKVKNATRRHRDEVAVKRQVKIAKQHGMDVSQPHRYAKHRAMDCGTPNCPLCGNSRRRKVSKTADKLTVQEHRFLQDIDHIRDKHSNGLTTEKVSGEQDEQ